MARKKRMSKDPSLEIENKVSLEEEVQAAPMDTVDTPVRTNRKPVPREIQLTARQYIRARKYRWDRCAGFLHDMKTKHGQQAKKTRPEWDLEWGTFWQRPVK